MTLVALPPDLLTRLSNIEASIAALQNNQLTVISSGAVFPTGGTQRVQVIVGPLPATVASTSGNSAFTDPGGDSGKTVQGVFVLNGSGVIVAFMGVAPSGLGLGAVAGIFSKKTGSWVQL